MRPNDSHPNRYWFKNQQKFISLWEITDKLDGMLFLVNYEDSREQFKVIKVLEMTRSRISKEDTRIWSFDEFKKWFQSLNERSIES